MGSGFSLLDDIYFLEHHLVAAADQSGAHVLNVSKKIPALWRYCINFAIRKPPFYSHLSRKNFAAIDCYTCGTTVEPQIAIDYIVNILKPERMHTKKLIRGIGEIVTTD
ncbi:S-adenosylmethionine decarboxylase [Bacillus cereus]